MVRFAVYPVRRVIAFARQYRYVAILGIALLVYLFWPKSRGVEPGNEQHQPVPIASVTTSPAAQAGDPQLASTQPATPQRAADLPLYAPGGDTSDPKWSLPAELKAEELQSFARRVEKLRRDIPATARLESECNRHIEKLIQDPIVAALWGRLLGKGFHDANLPLDWYQLVKDRFSVVGKITDVAEDFANGMIQATIEMRISSIQARIIGGRVLVGDVLFVKGTQAYIDQRRPYYQKLLPLLENVESRALKELQPDLREQQRRSKVSDDE